MSTEDNSGKVTRIIELKLPLTWLIGTAFGLFMALAGMYFNVDRLIRDVSDLQVMVKSGNAQAVTLAGQIELLKFRVESLESARRNRE